MPELFVIGIQRTMGPRIGVASIITHPYIEPTIGQYETLNWINKKRAITHLNFDVFAISVYIIYIEGG